MILSHLTLDGLKNLSPSVDLVGPRPTSFHSLPVARSKSSQGSSLRPTPSVVKPRNGSGFTRRTETTTKTTGRPRDVDSCSRMEHTDVSIESKKNPHDRGSKRPRHVSHLDVATFRPPRSILSPHRLSSTSHSSFTSNRISALHRAKKLLLAGLGTLVLLAMAGDGLVTNQG